MEIKHAHHKDERPPIPPDARFWQHARTPRNMGTFVQPSARATGIDSCGDKVQVELRIQGDTIEAVKCVPRGCVYTTACASAMSVLAAGCTLDEALQIQPEEVERELEGLPDDHRHCARLAVNTLGEAIADFYCQQHSEAVDRSY